MVQWMGFAFAANGSIAAVSFVIFGVQHYCGVAIMLGTSSSKYLIKHQAVISIPMVSGVELDRGNKR
jgi:hypothetical protein